MTSDMCDPQKGAGTRIRHLIKHQQGNRRTFHLGWRIAIFSTTFSSLFIAVSGFSLLKSWIPEDVVQMQLNALCESDTSKAFSYNSPDNKEITGPWQQYGELLSERPFTPIIGHSEAQVLMTVSHGDGRDLVCCLVRVVAGEKAKSVTVPEQQQKAVGDDEDEDDEEDDHDVTTLDNVGDCRPCVLYWWELSKHEDVRSSTGFRYMVDSVLPDAEDLEADFMDVFMLTDDDIDDDDDDGNSFFFGFDMGV